MKHIALPLISSLLSLAISQSALAQEIKFKFEHDGKNVSGFNFYMGEINSPMKIIKSAHNPTAREFSYQWLKGESEKCFGVSSYTSLNESQIVDTQGNGDKLCLGKPPTAPAGFSYSVQ